MLLARRRFSIASPEVGILLMLSLALGGCASTTAGPSGGGDDGGSGSGGSGGSDDLYPDYDGPADTWHLDQYRIQQAREDFDVTGEGITIGIMDTSIDRAHMEFAATDFQSAGERIDDRNGSVSFVGQHEHGTAVASVAAGMRTGVAPGADILEQNVDVVDNDGTIDIAPAFDQIRNMAADNMPDILNTSFGPPDPDNTSFEHVAEDLAYQHDIVFVASAGNQNRVSAYLREPSTVYNGQMIAAGRLSSNGDPTTYENPESSDYLVYAPGNLIQAAKPDPDQHEQFHAMSGTSISAPYISGVAALIRARYPEMSASEVVNLIIATAEIPDDAANPSDYGEGIIQPYEALVAGPDAIINAAIPNAEQAPDQQPHVGQTRAVLPASVATPQGLSQVLAMDNYHRPLRLDLRHHIRRRSTLDEQSLFDYMNASLRQGMASQKQEGAGYTLRRTHYASGVRTEWDLGSWGQAMTQFKRRDGLRLGHRLSRSAFTRARLSDYSRLRRGVDQHAMPGMASQWFYKMGDAWSAHATGWAAWGQERSQLRAEALPSMLAEQALYGGSLGFTRNDQNPESGFAEAVLRFEHRPEQWGQGALATEPGIETLSLGLRGEKSLGPWSFFAEAEQSWQQVEPQAGLIEEIDTLVSRKALVGTEYEERHWRVGLQATLPHRISNGTMHLRIPTARERDGTVHYTKVRADLSPEQRSQALEVYWQLLTNQATDVRAHILHVEDPDHEQGQHQIIYVGFSKSF